jgi:hypothetical protein
LIRVQDWTLGPGQADLDQNQFNPWRATGDRSSCDNYRRYISYRVCFQSAYKGSATNVAYLRRNAANGAREITPRPSSSPATSSLSSLPTPSSLPGLPEGRFVCTRIHSVEDSSENLQKSIRTSRQAYDAVVRPGRKLIRAQ